MAKVLGQSGRYVGQQAVNKFRSMLTTGMITIGILAAMSGFSLCLLLLRKGIPPQDSFVVSLALFVLALVVWKWSSRKMDQFERQRLNMRRGADGETLVGLTLANFPDDFYVINDISTATGNVDHVVVGRTGVFLIDTKNFRGVVSEDGHGELLVNGKPTDDQQVRWFTARIMDVKEKVRVLAPGIETYFQPVFVFPSARVEARWGKTGCVHCIREDQLFDYMVDTEFSRKIKSQDVKRIAQAFIALAHADAGFTEKAAPTRRSLRSTQAVPGLSIKQPA